MENISIELKTTKSIRYKLRKCLLCKELYDKLTKPKPFWYHKVSVSDKLESVRYLAEAKSDLWEEIYATYPEIVGKTINVSEFIIKLEE